MSVNVLFRKIKGFANRTWKDFQSDCHFSLYYALLRVVDTVSNRIGLQAISQTVHAAKDRWILRYLSIQLTPVISRYETDTGLGESVPNAPIWICWWTGEETAPELVRQCIRSIHRNAGSHPVHLITRENYQNYLDIPEFMLRKVTVGQMGLAHLADYMRVKLLAEYGGLWLDATIFCSQEIPAMCFDSPLFTCKGPVRESRYISNYRWVTFCLGGWKRNVFYRFLVEAFEQYWQSNDRAIDYLFFDYIIMTAYSSLPAVKALLDNLPDNNIHRDDLQAAMNEALPATEFDAVLQPDTALYKLSWREHYLLKTEKDSPTVYSRFINPHR